MSVLPGEAVQGATGANVAPGDAVQGRAGAGVAPVTKRRKYNKKWSFRTRGYLLLLLLRREIV